MQLTFPAAEGGWWLLGARNVKKIDYSFNGLVAKTSLQTS